MKLANIDYVHLVFYLAVNKLMINNIQNTFYLIAENSGFMKYTLKKLD